MMTWPFDLSGCQGQAGSVALWRMEKSGAMVPLRWTLYAQYALCSIFILCSFSLSSGFCLLERTMGTTTRFDAVHCIVGLSLPNCSRYWPGAHRFVCSGWVGGNSVAPISRPLSEVQHACAFLWRAHQRVVNPTYVEDSWSFWLDIHKGSVYHVF